MSLRTRLQPPKPSPLLFLPVQLGVKACWALLDSGAADNFISKFVFRLLELPTARLGMLLAVSVGNGEIIYTNKCVAL